MARYHINPQTGNPGLCKAQSGGCPFGEMEDHFDTKIEARNAYEKFNKLFTDQTEPLEFHNPIKLDDETIKLLDAISTSGAQPLVVGGAVRDSLAMDATPKDVDIEVHNVESMDELIELLKNSDYKVDEVGKKFGVLKTVLPNGMDVDISLPRKDNRIGAGHRGFEVEVDPTLSLKGAANRRDFTINALYYDHSREVIIDAVGGVADWEAKRLRHVSDAFAEDPLRVLRGVQFSSRFNLTIDPDTAAEAQRIKGEFKHTATEMVQVEWNKLFTKGKSISKGLETLRATGWDEHFGLDKISLPEASKKTDAVLRNARAAKLPSEVFGPGSLALQLPANERKEFLKQAIIGDRGANKILRNINTPAPTNASRKEINKWARKLSKDGSTPKEWLTLHSPFIASDAAQVISLSVTNEKCLEGGKPDFITGQMVMDATGDKKGGPWIGKLLKDAANAQDDEMFRDQKGAQTWLIENLNTFRGVK